MGFMKLFMSKKEPKRFTPADVKKGQMITVEWERISNKIGKVTCVNNDPKNKTMLIQV